MSRNANAAVVSSHPESPTACPPATTEAPVTALSCEQLATLVTMPVKPFYGHTPPVGFVFEWPHGDRVCQHGEAVQVTAHLLWGPTIWAGPVRLNDMDDNNLFGGGMTQQERQRRAMPERHLIEAIGDLVVGPIDYGQHRDVSQIRTAFEHDLNTNIPLAQRRGGTQLREMLPGVFVCSRARDTIGSCKVQGVWQQFDLLYGECDAFLTYAASNVDDKCGEAVQGWRALDGC